MPAYVAFLRAVNVRPRWVKMDQLRALLQEHGFGDVQTHIQSGNVRVTTPTRTAAKVEATLSELISSTFGFEVPVIARTPVELRDLATAVDALPSPLGAAARLYVVFVRGPLGDTTVKQVNAWSEPGERALVVGRDIALWIDRGFHEARFPTAPLWRSTPAVTTARDIKVVRALVEKWC
ncbi:MAG TPA: DUF1697 domain-containing protein [Intrasporangium sp.]|uniref:DUF1697 domain-containing protein n=1 Tax=Intrasporangium sp. TaxID=1925024 RepID=UPI002D7A2BAE|nr:DUF1697 domain-containing protein [Intrasporangium sp.]HET7397709.1 DUF1697 domain-containing protein [Intrasporangium sp.]